MVVDFPSHPTLLEIAQRQRKIDRWDLDERRGRRRVRLTYTLSLVVGLLILVTGALWAASADNILGAFQAAAGLPLCGVGVWAWTHRNDKFHGNRPAPLVLVPFSDAENRVRMSEQEPEVFLGGCTCPGCGELAIHKIRQPAMGEPEWAEVIRHCDVCGREWAQK
ncbi:hypothetical protein BST11_25460 [Mycobacterium alsense]|nr:hypothetical protein BST11_25460 [Mycobacterium alsense]